MLSEGYKIYLATRKKNDQLFNHYFMRVLAGYAVWIFAKTPVTPNQLTILNLALFLVAVAMLVVLPGWQGALLAMFVLELSYMLDCADGMLARHKKLASKTGHLFDFFTDEVKAAALVVGLGLRLAAEGAYGPVLSAPFYGRWSERAFLLATIASLFVITGAISLTKLQRHPDMSGKAQTVEAYYETVDTAKPRSPIARLVGLGFTFLRFLNHYPSHIYLFALAGRLDLFFFVYTAINGLYLAQGWLSLLLRFGRFRSSDHG